MANRQLKAWKIFLVPLVLLSCLVAYRVWATTLIMIGAMSSINGTNNGTSGSIGYFTSPGGRISIQNGGLTATNDLVGYWQISIDNSNFYTIGTYRPSITNAQTDTFLPPSSNITIYGRLQIVTTNTTSVGAVYSN